MERESALAENAPWTPGNLLDTQPKTLVNIGCNAAHDELVT